MALLGVLALGIWGAFAVFATNGPPSPTINSGPANNTTTRSATFNYSEVYGSNISMGPQAMQGDITVNAGDWVAVGWHVQMPGQHPASTVTFDNNQVSFAVTCNDGSTPTSSTFVVTAPRMTVSIGLNDTGSYPTSSGQAAASYEGAAQLPALCGSKASNIRLKTGGTFTSLLSSTDTSDKAQIQWHYVDTGAGKAAGNSINCSSATANPGSGLAACNGGWSGTLQQVPGTAQSSISFQCKLDSAATFTNCGSGSATGSISYGPPSGTDLTVGTHTFQVEAVVASQASSPTSFSWTIVKNSPTLMLAGPGTPGLGTAGTAVSASTITATLAGAYTPSTGTITFTVFGPSASAPTSCSSGGTQIGTAVTASANTGHHPNADFTPMTVGNYWLYASYGGDSNNSAAQSVCPPTAAQEIQVGKASPSLSLSGPGNPASVVVGTQVTGTSISAVLAGGASPTGSISFVYFQQTAAPNPCTGGSPTSIGSAIVSGNGTYHPSNFTPTSPGNYWLYASYGGDGNNNGKASVCPPTSAQEIQVVKATPALSLNGPGSPGSGTAGTAMSRSTITAGLTNGYNPTGTITFTIFGPGTAPSPCTSGGTQIGTAVNVTANANYHPNADFTPSQAGNYWLYASYGGDSNNNAAPSACPPGTAQEIQVGKASPTLTVSAPASLNAGDSATAAQLTATLAQSSGTNDTQTITFTVYGPNATAPTTCPGGAGWTTVGTAMPHGDGTYSSSAGWTPDTAGSYWWYVSSPADANNNPAASTCGSGMTKTVVAAPPNQLTIDGDAVGSIGPGGPAQPIAITFHNTNYAPVDVTSLTVTVFSTGVSGCSTSDFTITQSNITASNRFTVPKNGMATIPSTGPVSRPTIQMIDNGNQNLCKGAHLTLHYASS